MSKLQQWGPKIVEYVLYILFLVQPITGLGNTLCHGRPFTPFTSRVPALLVPDKTAFHMFQSVHEIGAGALLTLICLHGAAALFHGVVLRDAVIQRMWASRAQYSAGVDAVGQVARLQS